MHKSTPAYACLKLIELAPSTTPLCVGPALIGLDGKVTLFKDMKQLAAAIVVEGIEVRRLPCPPPAEFVVDLPGALWYELQALCAERLNL